ncbi:hypothetical protein Tco_0368339 [Tanacetum coccineum]
MSSEILQLATMDPPGDIMVQTSQPKRSLTPVSSGPPSIKMPTSLSRTVTRANVKEKLHNVMISSKLPSKFCEIFDIGHRLYRPVSRLHEGTKKYGVTHRLSTAYTLQTIGASGSIKLWLKRILERTKVKTVPRVGDKQDDHYGLSAQLYKTPSGVLLTSNVYGKACHLPIELDTKPTGLKASKLRSNNYGDHRKDQLNALNELRDHAMRTL